MIQRRRFLTLALTASLTGTLAACSTGAPSMPGASTSAAAIAFPGEAGTFTNMGDEDSPSPVLEALKSAGLPAADVDEFASQVRSLNEVATDGALVTAPVPLDQAQADDGTISAATDKQARLTNCRITVFTLAQSLITVGNTEGADTDLLFVDLDEIAKSPEPFSDNRADFEALYGTVPTTSEKDAEQRTADVKKYFEDHQISFASGPVSVVSVFIHDNLDLQATSFIGHTGVLAEVGEKLLFMEKLAFDAPYRAVAFESRAQLAEYLTSMYNDGSDMEYGQPLFFENGEPLAG